MFKTGGRYYLEVQELFDAIAYNRKQAEDKAFGDNRQANDAIITMCNVIEEALKEEMKALDAKKPGRKKNGRTSDCASN